MVPDKFQHGFGSYCLSRVIGPVPAIVAGIAKEFYDQNNGAGFGYRDLFADIFGVISAEVAGPVRFFPLYKPKNKAIYFAVTVFL